MSVNKQQGHVAVMDHLRPLTWARVNRKLVGKMLSEFAHEQLIVPVRVDKEKPEVFVCNTDDSQVSYTFNARLTDLEHWVVELDSISRRKNGALTELDAVELVLDFRQVLGIPEHFLDTYLEEVTGTLFGEAYKSENQRFDVHSLTEASFQSIEAAMTEGHPCFIANGARIGFNSEDYHKYAPEVGAPIRLVWIAAHRSIAHFESSVEASSWQFIEDELGVDRTSEFRAKIHSCGGEAEDYVVMPVHPWQWRNRLIIGFAGELSTHRLLLLDEGKEDYLAQQSIRTLFNQTRPCLPYIKVALSIVNMGFMRGLSPDYMKGTPAINQWVAELIQEDSFLQKLKFQILQEFASVGCRQPGYERSAVAGSAHRKMLAALWRESPLGKVSPGQSLATMASLLHRDGEGLSFTGALIDKSGLCTEQWTQHYLRAYLTPLLHCFFAHELAFMPHGENVILVLEKHVVRQIIVKDIGEEVSLFDTQRVLPKAVRRICVQISDEGRGLYIFTDIIDSFLRFLAPILGERKDFSEAKFWRAVAQCIYCYQDEHPHLDSQFKRFDLFAAHFERLCLNRLQLRNHKQLLDLNDPASSFQIAGRLENPLALYRRETKDVS